MVHSKSAGMRADRVEFQHPRPKYEYIHEFKKSSGSLLRNIPMVKSGNRAAGLPSPQLNLPRWATHLQSIGSIRQSGVPTPMIQTAIQHYICGDISSPSAVQRPRRGSQRAYWEASNAQSPVTKNGDYQRQKSVSISRKVVRRTLAARR